MLACEKIPTLASAFDAFLHLGFRIESVVVLGFRMRSKEGSCISFLGGMWMDG